MGAGGSTAASCSSLDLGNGQVPDKYRYYRQQNRHQQYLHEQRLLKYKKQARGGAKSGHHLKQQSSSQFDLTSCGLADNGESTYLRDDAELQYGLIHSQAAAAVVETYNLTDSDMARPMPAPTVMVLPPLPANKQHPAMTPLGGGAKKSNAGVASRILHQRQQQQQRRSSELKKFSDSLPSLNNIHQAATPGHDNIIHINHHQSHHLYNQHHHQAAPIDCYERTRAPVPSPNRQQPMKPSYRPSAIQANHKQQLLQTQEKVTNMNLVIDEPYRVRQSQWRAPYMTDHHDDGRRELPQSVLIKRQHVASGKHRQPQMKRATSLSSLHDLNQSHHQRDDHYHPRDDCQHQHDNKIMKRSSANLRHPSDLVGSGRSARPPSSNSCATDINERQIMLSQQYQHQLRNQRRSGYEPTQVQASCDVPHGQYRLPPQTPPKQQLQHNSAMLMRTNYKYKQAPKPGVNLSKNNRYKSKQQQQQQQPQVQGCPVLPPMPRSQSLHELIQLRATENGQRMRTTGTLRGPFGNGAEQANKVNLVAELLENRRQQRQTQEEDSHQVKATQNSETLLSQSSSTDDGIHDVSLNHPNTEPQTNSPQEQSISPIERSSISSQECDKQSSPSRQRVFKRQVATNAQVDRSSHQDKPSDKSHQRHQTRKLNKSTLKRSASHSALHHSRPCNISDSYDQDGDESDDLNELAKFLYEFKQRQAKNQAAQASRGDANRSTDADAGEPPAAASDGTRNENFQQSPNSTTSSSGFASSTCTAHSISSSSGRELKQGGGGGDKFHSVSSASSREVLDDVARPSSLSGKVLSPKKYPAPPRPGGGGDPGRSKNCPISGKIKASSSLLSIVDECQPPPSYTRQGQPQESSQPPSSLLYDADYQSRAKGDGHKREVDEFKIDRVAHNNNNSKHQQQLEQLRKYTNMRQMSRSELALNHLTSSSVLDPVANRRQQQEQEIMQVKHQKHNGGESSKKPYANRLFNLIRRISDRSEAPNGAWESGGGCGDSLASASGRRSSAGLLGRTGSGGKYSSDAAGGGCRPIDGREEINQKSELMNSGYPNKSAGGGGHSEQQARSSAVSGQLRSGRRPRDAVLCKASAVASESLCDLNFDCDFELIKKCASSANESVRTQTSATSHNGTGHNESGRRRYSCKNSDGENKRSKQGRCECPIIDPTGRENNWRLAPTSSLLGLTHFSRGGGDGAVNGDAAPHTQRRPFVKHDNNDNYNNDGSGEKSAGGKTKFATKGGSSFDVRGGGSGTRPEDKLPTAPQQQNKLKWSASSWFLGGTGSSSGSSKNKKEKKDKSSGSCPLREQTGIAEKCKSTKPNKEKSYLARLLPNSGGTATSSSSGSKSKQKVECDDNDNVISEADQLLVELDQSLDLVSGSSRRRRSTRPSGENLSVPWWQQVSNKITEEEARMMHEAQLNAISGDESSAISDSDDDDDYDAYDNDDADYASINRALINETFDVDLSRRDESNHSNLYGDDQQTIEQPGSPSDSFTFSAPSSPTPSERSPRAAAAANSTTNHKIDGAKVATNGLAKPSGCLNDAHERPAQDKQRSSGGNSGGVAAPCSSKFTYNRSAKTTTPTGPARAPAAPASANTNCSGDERDVGAKLGVGDVGNNKRSNLEKEGICRPAVAVVVVPASEVNSRGERSANQMAEAATGKKSLSDNKIVDPSSSENSHTFTKVIPQGGVTVATTTTKRHPRNDETAEQVLRDSSTQMKGVAHGSQIPSQLALRQTTTTASLNDDRTRCMTNIVRRDNESADADVGSGCVLRNDKAKKPSPVSSKHLNSVDPARNSGCNDVIGLVANGNKITSVCLNCHRALDSDDPIRPSDSGSSECCASEQHRRAPSVFNDPLCPIHGQAICCAHSSGSGQGESGGNLKQQQQQRRQRRELSGQCQLDTNGVERCGYDTESDNSKPRVRKSSSGCAASEEVTVRDTSGRQRAQVANGKGNAVAHKLACQQSACENGGGGSGMSDNRLGACNESSAAAAAVVARTKTGHHHHKESVVCNHRPVTPEETGAAPSAAGNNKLIIQRNSCLCDASDPPLANENLGAPGKRLDGKSSNFSDPTCWAAAHGCTPAPGGASLNRDGNASSSPKVTYYHYSHEMKNFTPTTAAAAAAATSPSGGKLRVDSKDRCCGRAVGSDQCRLGKHQQHSDKRFCITTTPDAPGGNNKLARKSEISSSSSSPCETGCLYHPNNSSFHDDVSSRRHPANEDVKATPSCCSHNKTKKPTGSGVCSNRAASPDGFTSPGKNKAPLDDALKPMTGNDNERHTKLSSSKTTDSGQVVSPPSQVAARNDECHCCHVTGATGASQTNGQPAAEAACPARFHSHAECDPKQPLVRCNPICRSNSELVVDMLPIASGKKSGQNRRVSDVLFGRLRNSLLNQRASSPSPTSHQKHLLGSSQVSLANNYGDGGTQQLIQSMLIPTVMGGVGSSPVVNDFDDNFILKRKTPNAGLKSRC